MQDMPKSVVEYYRRWIHHFPDSWSETDLELFYMFVSVLLTCSKKSRSGVWLEENLKEDCTKLTLKDIKEYANIYEHIRDFKKVWKGHTARLIAQDKMEKHMNQVRNKYEKKLAK